MSWRSETPPARRILPLANWRILILHFRLRHPETSYLLDLALMHPALTSLQLPSTARQCQSLNAIRHHCAADDNMAAPLKSPEAKMEFLMTIIASFDGKVDWDKVALTSGLHKNGAGSYISSSQCLYIADRILFNLAIKHTATS